MPSVENVLDTYTHSYWFGDVESAGIFHKYKLSEKAQPYAGVGVSWAEKGKTLRWELWTRMTMGLLSSPFATTRIFECGVEVIIGDQNDESKTFIGMQ